MSENSSEYLKRTCLICGCHTNQTINIYEPRSGPNIVQLIQAKFKFQPLNEDKYLCFSCNNWLINWHSLQALNSNDAESPSGTFRAHLNSGNVMQDAKSSGSKAQIAVCRPIAHVKPRQIVTPSSVEHPRVVADVEVSSNVQQEFNDKTSHKINFNKRHFRLQSSRRGRVQHKVMQLCACGKYIVVRRSTKFFKVKPSLQTKCRRCRELSRLKIGYLSSIYQVEKMLTPLLSTHNPANVTGITTANQSPASTQINHNRQTQHRLHLPPNPTVNGKVVAMLRRLGTTLSREPFNGNGNDTGERLPQIMSPTKPSSKWMRPLEEDEVLVNFDTSISEVLPSLADQFTHVNSIAARKKLTFHVSQHAEIIDLCDEYTETRQGEMAAELCVREHLATTFNLPKGLDISLAS